MKKVGIFVDWENLKQEIITITKPDKKTKQRKISFSYTHQGNLFKLINLFLDQDEEIYRIFFYTALPLKPEELNKIIKNKFPDKQYEIFKTYFYGKDGNKPTKFDEYRNKYEQISNFLFKLSQENFMALRTGNLKVNGLTKEGQPQLTQKQVDMLIGLDIAHVAHYRLVDRILVFCKDTDIIPALKVARTNGIQTLLGHLKEGYNVDRSIKKHIDIVRIKELETLSELKPQANKVTANT